MAGMRLPGLAARFLRDEQGAFAIIFAMIAIVLLAMGGSAVDFTALQQARTRAQVALDAASLALQPTIYTASPSGIQGEAQALLLERLADAASPWGDCAANGGVAPCVHVDTPAIDTADGQLRLTATLTVPMNFVRLVGVPTLSATLVSAATRKMLALEVAMVLDNSGSMSTSFGSGSRMSVLQSSARCAANILFYGVSTCSASTGGITPNPKVKLAIVPFTMEVNVGTGNAGAAWLDRAGTGSDSITADNFDGDDHDATSFAGPVDRIALFSGMNYSGAALSWGGCVEARRHPYDVDDTAPDAAVPNTLFTPFFAPDEPGPATKAGSRASVNGDSFYNSYIADGGASCNREPVVVHTEVKTLCNTAATSATSYNYACGGTTTDSYTQTDQTGATSSVSAIPATIFDNPVPSTYAEAFSYVTANGKYTNTRTRTYTYVYSNREYQERLCKYAGATLSYPPSVSKAYGPNSDCPANAVTPLSSTPATVTAAINAMSAQGGTNITEGAAWGWRVLSPTAPFTEGGPYDTATAKVMILMTDGENTAYQYGNMNDAQYYSAYGYPWNSTEHSRPAGTRLGTSTATDAELEGGMNDRLATVCSNAKAAGVTIYTIGIATDQTSNPSANEALLTGCATDPRKAYFPTSASALQGAFVAIANELSALRLSQ